MRKILLTAAAGMVTVLSGCSDGRKQPDTAASNETARPLAVDSSTSPGGKMGRADIPEALRGRWGLVAADCTSTMGDAKGLLTVSAEQLKFYESVAKLGDVKAREPEMIAAAFDFTGEGQNWTLDVTLSSPDGGKTLVRKDTGPDAAPAPLTYRKCP